ncbi:MAG TPA: PIG-L family deacetylase [Verrucomicrobia bacterium]|nr:PIG-L family deacetylase [Verrucomicrobiota bacterium]
MKSVLILAPHPDDESIIGLLPLRLREECGFSVWVVPATLGSHPDRHKARKLELRKACQTLGFRLRLLKTGDPSSELRVCFEAIRPAMVLLPHAKDGHPTHRRTHQLGVAAMDASRRAFHVVETEYWHPLERPNLMVAASGAQLKTLRRALACHKGEIERNDYAARLPAWMSDNVRRGAELVGGRGAAAPAIAHATLYRARQRAGGKWRTEFRSGRIIESTADLAALAGLWG